MVIQTKYFGEIQIDETKVIHFEQGIFGFEDQKEFAILYAEIISVYTVTVVPENIEQMTTNLRAPIVLNLETKKGAQIVIEAGDYPIRENLYQRIKQTREE